MPIEPDDSEFERGFQLRCEGRYQEAKLAFQSVLRGNPTHAKALHQMALVKGFEGDFDGSLADLQALVAKNPTNPDIRCDLAMTQMMLGMYEEACANLKEVLRIAPDHEMAHRQISYC